MTTPLHDIAALDVPLPVVEAEICFLQAAERTHSPSDRIAFALDAWLVTHPKAPVSRDADYDGWSEWIAARQDEMNRAHKEASNA